MRARAGMLAERGLLAPGQQTEEIVVIAGHARRAGRLDGRRSGGDGVSAAGTPHRVTLTPDGPVLVRGPGRGRAARRDPRRLRPAGRGPVRVPAQPPLPVLRHQPPPSGPGLRPPRGRRGGPVTTDVSLPLAPGAGSPGGTGPLPPSPRGPLSTAVLAMLTAVDDAATAGARRVWPRRRSCAPRPTRTATTCSWPCTLLRAALPRLRGRLRRPGVGPRRCCGCAGPLERRVPRRAAPRRARRRTTWPARSTPLLVEDLAPQGVSHHLRRDGRGVAAARVRRAALALPPQGGRPAGVGDPPAGRARPRRRS